MHQNTVKNNSNKFQQSVENYAENLQIKKLSSLLMTKNIVPFQVKKRLAIPVFILLTKKTPPDDVKFKSKQKFEPKILVWLSLSSKGISTPFIGTTKGPAVDTDVYTRKCLPKLLKFIEKHHLDDKYIFWPDLASSQLCQ